MYKPRVGDLIMVHRHTPLETLTEWGEEIELLRHHQQWPNRPVYGHVCVYIGNGTIIEALGRGLTVSKLSKYIGEADVWSHDVSGYDRDQIRHASIHMYRLGYGYSWWLDFLLALRMLFAYPVHWKQRKRVNCSAFAYDVWQYAWHKIAKHRACSPEDIATFGYMRFQGVIDANMFNNEE